MRCRDNQGNLFAIMVDCKDCRYLVERPGDTVWKRKGGCFHPDHMEQRQDDEFLREQEIPGDPRKVNADGNCPTFEALPPRLSLLGRLVRAMRA